MHLSANLTPTRGSITISRIWKLYSVLEAGWISRVLPGGLHFHWNAIVVYSFSALS